jgi:hypothetical protein
MKKPLLMLMIALLVLSCSNKTKVQRISIEQFPISKNVTFYEITTPPVIPFVGDMLFLDSTLVVLDMMSDTIFHLFEATSFKYERGQIKRGQGPKEEVAVVPYISRINGNTFLYRSIQNVKLVRVVNGVFDIVDRIQLPDAFNNVMHIIKLNDFLYGYDIQGQNITEYVGFNLSTKKQVNIGGEFPEVDMQIEKGQENMLYSRVLVNKDDGSKFAALYDKFPFLRIYDQHGNLLTETRYGNNQKKPTAYLDANVKPSDFNETTINYQKLKATNSYIYGLYVGKTHGELNTFERKNADYGHEIHVWDWDGKPVAKYILEQAIFSFAVSPDDRFIICSSVLNDDKLYKFELNH